MSRFAAAALFILGLLSASAQAAEDRLKEGRSVAACSPATLVCAVMKDGSMQPTDECAARRNGAVRVLQGDCYDAD